MEFSTTDRGLRPIVPISVFCFSGSFGQLLQLAYIEQANTNLTLKEGLTFIFLSLALTLLVDFNGVEEFDPLRRSGVPVALPGADRVCPIKK